MNSVKDCFNTNFLTHLPKIENFYEREPSDNEISIFKCHSKQLIYINLTNFDSYRLRLQLPEKINSSAFNCLLPDKSIFSYGNFSYEYSGITFIIEKSQRVVNLPPGASCTGSGGLYLKGFVYTFGGKNHDGMMNRAEKFIFENDLLE